MAIHPDIRDEAFIFFVQEAPELLQVIEAELLEIREDCSVERVHVLMRAAHTIKGGSANVGLDAIKAIAHRLEDFFRCLYNPDVAIDETLEQLFLQGYDCLRIPLMEAIQVGDQWEDGEAALAVAEPIFAQLHERLADFITDDDHLPSVAEMGIDIAQSIFETDVAQALERLEAIEGDASLVEGELRAQAEVFEGIAELLNLPGLTQIAHLVMAALDAEPERALDLFPIALENFRAAHQAVLGGDRTQGGTPSSHLQNFIGSAAAAQHSPEPLDTPWLSSGEAIASDQPWFELPEQGGGAIDPSFFQPLEGSALQEESFFQETEGSFFQGESFFQDGESFFQEPEGSFFQDEPFLQDAESFFQKAEDSSRQTESFLQDDEPRLQESEGSILAGEDFKQVSEEATLQDESCLQDKEPFFQDIEDLSAQNVFSLQEVEESPQGEESLVQGVEEQTTEDADEDAEQAALVEELESIFSTHLRETGDRPDFSAFLADLEQVFNTQDAPPSNSVGEPSGTNVIPPEPQSDGVKPRRFPLKPAKSKGVESNVAQPKAVDAPPVVAEKLDAKDGNVNPGKAVGSAIAAIQQTFDQLPVASEPDPIALHPTKVEKTPAKKAKTTPQPSTTGDGQIFVRLNLDQLERISNQLGELSINRNSLSLQNEQLQETLQELRRRFGNFLGIGTQLRSHLNKLLISPERYSLLQQSRLLPVMREHSNGNSHTTTVVLEKTADLSYRATFDTLELDRYNDVYNLLQDATESIQQLDEAVEDVTLFAEQSDRGLEQQRQILTVLRDELMWARMLPLGNILNRFPRQIKDLSYQYKKPVSLKLTGTEVLVDKVVLEKLYDPLLHLLRNAFDHGIEPSNIRRNQGKTEQGIIEIRVYHRGSRTIIEIEDDGRGINLERIRVKGVETGLLSAEAAKTASSDRLLNIIFEPGFSTASQVSELSGRGVGLDIVRAQIQSLKGSITVNSRPGKGTLFTLRIPLTLSISKLLLTLTGESLAAIPSDSIEEIVNPNLADIKTSGDHRFLHWRNQVIPIHPLQELLPYNCTLPGVKTNLSFSSVPTPKEWAAPLLVLRQGNQPFALEVDRLITEQELVIKPFSDTLPAPSYLYGCTILGDGSIVPVLDAVTLLLHRQGHKPAAIAPTLNLPSRSAQTVPTVLIVDDAATMRQMLTLTLKKAGYQVIQARDGREALEQLSRHSQIQLVICDIEMPTMNGFEFLTHRRQNPALMKVPVVMLTSRSGEKHRKLALHLGATNYFTKPYIEQQLLAHLKTLLQDKADG